MVSWKVFLLFAGALAGGAGCAGAAPVPKQPAVVMLSDFHFDPFHDPAKFPRLMKAPVARWAKILEGPASATQGEAFDGLQKTCKARGVDSSWAVLKSSLEAAHRQQPGAAFVLVAGDLMAHNFDCRFEQMTAGSGNGAAEGAYAAFAEKTVAFVALQTRLKFPGTPVYLALGNNDSGCGDYHETPRSEFLQAGAQSFSADVEIGQNRAAVLGEFAEQGDYTVALPKPMVKARLMVLQDMFASPEYKTCEDKTKGKGHEAHAEAQIAWLRAQLTTARQEGEHVWVMAHIPPGVDVYSTVKPYARHPADVTGATPKMMLASEALADALLEFSDVVRLAVFAHTHCDEMRLLQDAAGHAVAAKLLPSVSPVNGNNPAFTVATVDPATAVMQDYSVFAANNQTGRETVFRREYGFRETYGAADFSVAGVRGVVEALVADRAGTTESSQAYERFYFVGDEMLHALALQMVWPAYACSMTADHAEDYVRCLRPVVTP